MSRRKSQEAAIIDFFRTAQYDLAVAMLGIVKGEMKMRSSEGEVVAPKPRKKRKKATAVPEQVQ